jgi:transglutaminase-like putative cysteine protease
MRAKYLLPFAIAAIALSASSQEGVTLGAKARKFELTYTATIKDVPADVKTVDLWIPVPQTDSYQEIGAVKFSPAEPAPELASEPTQNNMMAHWKLPADKAKGFSVSMTVECTRHEIVTSDLSKARDLTDEERTKLAPYLKANKLVLVGGEFVTVADNATKGAKTPVEIAKAAYDFAVTTMKYDKPKDKPGWGQGSTKWACDSKFGNCTDFHALVMSIGRTKGVPVKFEIGFPIPEDSKAGPVGGYHCWAKSYLGGVGWMPVDASEAQKHPEKKDYFCGSLCPNRIHFSNGRDVDLAPKQAGDALNFFIYPYAEADGKSIPVDKAFAFKDL